MPERDDARFAGLELAEGGVGIGAVVGRQTQGLGGGRLASVVRHGHVDAHVAVGADDLPREGEVRDGQVADAGGHLEGAPDEARAGWQAIEQRAEISPDLGLAELPADGLAVADDENLLVAVAAAGE